ncbi:invasion associated locus B family protein [Microvirga sp. 2TAF3]|uniref:invasion associated locus B family protein n=1 Tax=Microvirga sp. 2TAF3 TaxID=3233014 RepID=UPI003F976346
MILASLQRGLAAGVISAAFVIGTGPEALAQGPTGKPQPNRAAQAKPAAKAPAKASAAKPAAAAAGAAAAAKPAQAATGPGGATLLASYGDWGVYTAKTGRSEICYALSQPKDRLPKNLNRDPAYLFVSFRPAENVKNEVAVVLGFAAKDNGPAEAAIGKATYALLTKDRNAWLKNPAEESQAIATMGKSQSVTVKTQSIRGNQLTDRYSLNGFVQALERARKECS